MAPNTFFFYTNVKILRLSYFLKIFPLSSHSCFCEFTTGTPHLTILNDVICWWLSCVLRTIMLFDYFQLQTWARWMLPVLVLCVCGSFCVIALSHCFSISEDLSASTSFAWKYLIGWDSPICVPLKVWEIGVAQTFWSANWCLLSAFELAFQICTWSALMYLAVQQFIKINWLSFKTFVAGRIWFMGSLVDEPWFGLLLVWMCHSLAWCDLLDFFCQLWSQTVKNTWFYQDKTNHFSWSV